jgi:hypothetical protein
MLQNDNLHFRFLTGDRKMAKKASVKKASVKEAPAKKPNPEPSLQSRKSPLACLPPFVPCWMTPMTLVVRIPWW